MSKTWLEGLVAGVVGGLAMTLGEKAEQMVTGRPNSYVPAMTLGRLLHVSDQTAEHSPALNLSMHFGQAAVLGMWRSVMAQGGLRGPRASLLFTFVRFANDQTLENYTGAGAPPWTWPRRELVIDVAHKTVYGMVTGMVADRLAARRGPGLGAEHASLRPARQENIGPPVKR